MNENDLSKEMYEKAIERYLDFEKKYKEWMYLYAIFVGALFVAIYSVGVHKGSFLSILISIVGIVTSFCWLGSFYGHYKWLLNWSTILDFREEIFLNKNVENKNEIFQYRLYTTVNKDILNKYGFSTQNITNLFIRVVIVSWTLMFFYHIKILDKDIVCNCKWICPFIMSVIFILFPLICNSFCPTKRRGCWLLSDISSKNNFTNKTLKNILNPKNQ